MFFVFYILVFTIFTVSKTNNLPINPKTERDEQPQNGLSFSTQRPLFEILRNRKGTNLKSNVFDKMLSDEMFSIKQHFHEKDMTFLSSTPKSTKFFAQTPTLDVKQRWLVMELSTNRNKVDIDSEHGKPDIDQSKLLSDDYNENTNSNLEQADVIGPKQTSEKKLTNDRDKSLDLRSLPENSHVPHVAKYCTCMKTNPSNSCSHRCTGGKSNSHACSCNKRSTKNTLGTTRATTNNPELQQITNKCTRKYHAHGVSITDFQYMNNFNAYQTYQPYVVYTYYQPDILGNIKIPKPSKNKQKPFEDNLYYDDDKESPKHDKYADDYLYEDESNKKIRDDIVVSLIEENNDGANNNKMVDADKAEEHNELVENLVNDLKTHHSEVMIKTCYCSSAKTNIGFNSSLSYLSVFMMVSLQFIS